MAFKKGFTRHKWPVAYRLQQKKKLEVFLENVHILNDFLHALSFAEFQIIYMKVTGSQRTFDELLDIINRDYVFLSSLKEHILSEFGKNQELNIRLLKRIYNKGIDKILASGVDFTFDKYTLNISYEGKGQNYPINNYPKRDSPVGWHSYILDEPVRSPIKPTPEMIEKIKSNRVLEQQECGGLHDKESLPMLASQLKSIEGLDEDVQTED